jgi:hypothetical protein
MEKIKWYHYLAAFFAGFFLTNAVPHFVNGVSGNAFPSPFADPPGKGLSSPLVNTSWACFNLVVGYFLLRAGKVSSKNRFVLVVFFIAIVITGIMLSLSFVDKAKI